MKLEVGNKYTDGRDVVEIKFIDWEGSGWGLTDERKSCRYIKTYDTAWTEVIDKPDPGEGWRLLGPDEDLESGDQYYLRFSDPFENWATVKCSDLKQTPGMYYRRRIAPQYVPYTWEDREELRGRWYRNKETKLEAMVYYFSPLGSDFRINSYCPEMFLELCDWLDGSPCGKKVV
jgi:hypothetical protein